jgi:hypothetical protein
MNAPRSRLLAVKWTEEQMILLDSLSEPTVHSLFVSFMYAASKFAIPDTNDPEAESLNETALFEFGCYFYTAVDLWFFANKPNLREQISLGFYDEFVTLYSQIFQMEKPSIGRIFNQRVTKYGELYRSNFPDMKKISWNLAEVIMASKRNARPEPYDFEKGPLMLNAVKRFELEVKFRSWFIHIFPAYIESLERACRSIPKAA